MAGTSGQPGAWDFPPLLLLPVLRLVLIPAPPPLLLLVSALPFLLVSFLLEVTVNLQLA